MLVVSQGGTWLGIRSRLGIRLAGIVLSIMAAWVVRALGTVFGADFVVSDRYGSLHVTESVCANFAFQVGVKGLVMIMLLELVTVHARRIWTIGGWLLLVVSYLPIVTVQATMSTRIFLTLINTATAVVFISAVRANVRPPARLRPAARLAVGGVGVLFSLYVLAGLTPLGDVALPYIAPVDIVALPVVALVALVALAVQTVRGRRARPGRARDAGDRARVTV